MKEFLKKKGIYIAVAAVFIAIAAAISAALSGGNAGFAAALSDPFWRPLKSAMTSFVGSLEDVYNYMYNYDNLEAENAELKARIAKLEDDYRTYTEINAENLRLKRLLEFDETRADDNFKPKQPTAIISWSASNFSSSFTIGQGSNAGVALGDCVITENGYLVGRITEVSATSATVTTVLDTTVSIGAMIYESGETGILEGDFDLFKKDRIKLSYLSEDADVIIGNTVVTSGKGGLYPAKLVVGYIESLSFDPSGLSPYAVVKPAADINSLTYVCVLSSNTDEEAD